MYSKIIIGLYVLAASSALVFMKLGSSSGPLISLVNSKVTFNLNPVVLLGGFLYFLSFTFYTFLIAKYDLGYIIPLVTALIYTLIFIASFVVFKETFTTYKLIGIALIVIGVTFLNINK